MPSGSNSSFDNPSWVFLAVDRVLLSPLLAPIYRGFVSQMGLEGDERVLELGSGTGSGSRHLAAVLSNGGRLVCLDTSKALCAVARRRLARWPSVEVVAGDVADAQLPGEPYDVAVIHFMLHDVEPARRPGFVQAVTQKLVPGGVLQIREPTKQSHGMPASEIRELMHDARMRELRGREHRLGLLGRVFTGSFQS